MKNNQSHQGGIFSGKVEEARAMPGYISFFFYQSR